MEFVNGNIQKTVVANSELNQVYAKNEDIKVYGKLVSMSTENVIADSEQIWDDKQKRNQQDINKELCSAKDQYIKKSGDTMTGDLYIQGGKVDADSIDVAEVAHISENHFQYSDKSGKTLNLDYDGLSYGNNDSDPIFNIDSDGVISKQITVSGSDNSHTIIQPNEFYISGGGDELTISPTSIALNGLISIKTGTTKSDGLIVSLNSSETTLETRISPSSIQMIKSYEDEDGSSLYTNFSIIDGILQANKIKKSGGEPTQFLMADGSIKLLAEKNGVASLDENGYVPLSQLGNVDTVIAMVVTQLPTTDIKANKIYLVKDSSIEQDLYQEYLYINGKWEKIGTHKYDIDLSDYARKEDIITKVATRQVNGKSQISYFINNIEYATDLNEATSKSDGVMSSADKVKLDGIAAGANKYVLPIASNSTIGGIKTRFVSLDSSSKDYPVEVDSTGNAFVHVPWTDNQDLSNCATLSNDNKFAGENSFIKSIYSDDTIYALNGLTIGASRTDTSGNTISFSQKNSDNSLMIKLGGDINGGDAATGISTIDGSPTKLFATDGSFFDVSTLATKEALNAISKTANNNSSILTNIYYEGKITSSALPIATTDIVGGIKLGTGLSAAADGTVSVSASDSIEWDSIKNKPTILTANQSIDNMSESGMSSLYFGLNSSNSSISCSYSSTSTGRTNSIIINNDGITRIVSNAAVKDNVFMTDGTTAELKAITEDELNKILV